MKSLLISAALLTGAAFAPALAHTKSPSAQPNASSSEQQNDPGTGGRSKAGVAGQPGNKSGPSDKSNSNGAGSGEQGTMSTGNDAGGADESKVPGLPGNKSGPAQKPNK
jgi:hypothetical protein